MMKEIEIISPEGEKCEHLAELIKAIGQCSVEVPKYAGGLLLRYDSEKCSPETLKEALRQLMPKEYEMNELEQKKALYEER